MISVTSLLVFISDKFAKLQKLPVADFIQSYCIITKSWLTSLLTS